MPSGSITWMDPVKTLEEARSNVHTWAARGATAIKIYATAQGEVLLLWSQGDRDRVVTWTTGAGEQRVTFRGGIIMLANRPLGDLPELRELASRIAVHRLEVSDAAKAAYMRWIAGQGFGRGPTPLS